MSSGFVSRFRGGILLLLLFVGLLRVPPTLAVSSVSPLNGEFSFQNLAYGASSPYDVQRVMDAPPDEVVKSEQMLPVIENHYYFSPTGDGSATVFVFENNFLMGLHYKSPTNQFVDLTYFLPNRGDRQLTSPFLGGMQGYYPAFPFYQW